MTEYHCDRCGKEVSLTGYRAKKGDRTLILCPEHLADHDDALTKQKFEIERLTPPDPEFGLKVKTDCKCGKPAFSRPVKASPGSVTVDIVHCKDCDTRTCSYVTGRDADGKPIKCDSKALDRNRRTCPRGHALMGADAP